MTKHIWMEGEGDGGYAREEEEGQRERDVVGTRMCQKSQAFKLTCPVRLDLKAAWENCAEN